MSAWGWGFDAADQPAERPTDQQIRALRLSALEAGSPALARICDGALRGDPNDIRACAEYLDTEAGS